MLRQDVHLAAFCVESSKRQPSTDEFRRATRAGLQQRSAGIGVTPGGFRDALRGQQFLLAELLVAAAMLAAGFAGLLPFSATPFLLVIGVASLWLRGEGARAVGLTFRSDWARTVLVGIGAGMGYQGFSLFVVEPALARLTGRLPDVSLFAPP